MLYRFFANIRNNDNKNVFITMIAYLEQSQSLMGRADRGE